MSLKLCARFSIFDSVSVYFCSTKGSDSLILKGHNSFQNKNNRKTHSFAPRPFHIATKILKIQYLPELELPKN